MARSFLCINCSIQFPNDAAYMVHKKSGHVDMTGATPLDSPTPSNSPLPPGIPESAAPSPEFMETIKRLEGAKEPEPSSTPSQHPTELPKAAPLVLEYVWKGEHEKCRRQPSTLKLEVGGKFFSVAYCDSCKEQLESKEVTKL
jgi:hypothetical protein